VRQVVLWADLDLDLQTGRGKKALPASGATWDTVQYYGSPHPLALKTVMLRFPLCTGFVVYGTVLYQYSTVHFER
jgi:hypothetical protein